MGCHHLLGFNSSLQYFFYHFNLRTPQWVGTKCTLWIEPFWYRKNHIIKDPQGRFICLQQYDLWDIKSVGECKESDDLLLKRIHIYWWFSETFVSKDVKCLILIPVHKALPYLPRINVNVCNISRSINFNWKPTKKKTFTIRKALLAPPRGCQ